MAGGAQSQLEHDVAVVEAANGAIRETNARLAEALRRVSGADFGTDSEAWLKWWMSRRGYQYIPPEKRPAPTVDVQVPLPYVPASGPPVLTSGGGGGGGRGWCLVLDKEKGQKAKPGTCFAAGTLVLTPDGPRAIETLRTGEQVLTGAEGNRPGQSLTAAIAAVHQTLAESTLATCGGRRDDRHHRRPSFLDTRSGVDAGGRSGSRRHGPRRERTGPDRGDQNRSGSTCLEPPARLYLRIPRGPSRPLGTRRQPDCRDSPRDFAQARTLRLCVAHDGRPIKRARTRAPAAALPGWPARCRPVFRFGIGLFPSRSGPSGRETRTSSSARGGRSACGTRSGSPPRPERPRGSWLRRSCSRSTPSAS